MGKVITLRQKGNETCPNTTDTLTWEIYARGIYAEIIVNEKKDQINCSTSINVINQCHMTQSHITQSNKILKMRNGMDLKPLGTTRLKVKKVKNPKTQKKYSIEFVVVADSLTPLKGACTTIGTDICAVR